MSVCGTLFLCTGLLVHPRRVCATPCPGVSFLCTGRLGHLNRAGGSPCPGGIFSAPADRGARTASAGSPLTGGKFFAEPQRGDSPSADGGSVAAPAAGAKRKGHLRFPFLFELLPFPCFLIWRRFPICDRFENRERQRIFSSVSFATCSQGQIHYCYTDRKVFAGAA